MVRLILLLIVIGLVVVVLRAVGLYLVLGALGLVVLAAWRPEIAARISGSASFAWLPAWVRQTPMRFGVVLLLVLGSATALAYQATSGPASASAPPALAGGLTATPTATPSATPERRSHRPKATQRPSSRPGHRPMRHSVALFSHRPTGPARQALVTRVIDGDTIEVSMGGRLYHVRYIGMDTPEVYFGVEPMGPEASAANKRLVSGRNVVLEKDVSETDRYGRLLRFVWLHTADGWLFVNAELLREGYAQVTTYPPDVEYVHLFLRAQRLARLHHRGLWDP